MSKVHIGLMRETLMRPLPDCVTHVRKTDCHCMKLTLIDSLAAVALSAACTHTEAQQAPPAPPQVTVANVVSRDVTEWDEFTGRPQAVDAVDLPHSVLGSV